MQRVSDLRVAGLPGAAHLALANGVVHLDPRRPFEAMLAGWSTQQRARFLKDNTIGPRQELVRRFARFTNEYPWQWTPADVEAFIMRSPDRTVPPRRNYQNALRLFVEYPYRRALLVAGQLRGAVRCHADGRSCTSGTRSRMSPSTRATRAAGR